MSYITAHALSPYFTQATVSELKEGASYFTLQFDEMLNAQVKKQMVSCWGIGQEQHQEVRVKYFTSVMFGHAKAESVVKEIMDTLQKWAVPLKLLRSLGMDGQNVNKAVCSKVNQLKEELGEPPLVIWLPRCLLHVCHNSFRKGLLQYGMNAEELCLSLFYFFKWSSCRREDLLQIEESLGLDELIVLHHVRVTGYHLCLQLNGCFRYRGHSRSFSRIWQSDETIGKNDRYLSIKSAVESREVQLEMEFIKSIKPLFDDFLTKFQKEEPMVHLLSPSCRTFWKVWWEDCWRVQLSVAKKARIWSPFQLKMSVHTSQTRTS